MSISLTVDAVPVSALLVDEGGAIVALTPHAARLVGDVEGKPFAGVAPSVRWEASYAACAAGEIVEDTTIATRDGTRGAWLSISRHEIAGASLACVLIFEHRERLESDSANQRLESLGLVAGSIAHDFNNLLVGVLAEASSAREERSLTDDTREALRRIEAAAKRMAQLTRQLLAFAGRAQFATAAIEADNLLDDARDSLARLCRPNLKFTITLGAPKSVIEADMHLLRQVFANLVSNASDAASKHVEITTQLITRDGVPYWQLEVSDDGPGIDASALPRIFEPFFSTKSGHHGLGLSAVHGIVKRLNGDVEVDTRAGNHPQRGSRFRVHVPIAVGMEVSHERVPSDAMVPLEKLTGLRALVADDEPSVRATVRRLLERRGATVVVAADGVEAEAHLRAEKFQLVVTDVAMPGHTGWDVLAVARATQPGVRVVLMSGYTEKLRGTGSEEEPDAFLEKPFTAKGLDTTVDEVLKGR